MRPFYYILLCIFLPGLRSARYAAKHHKPTVLSLPIKFPLALRHHKGEPFRWLEVLSFSNKVLRHARQSGQSGIFRMSGHGGGGSRVDRE